MCEQSLGGLRVLLVEDEPIIALDIAQTLVEAGAEVIGPALRVAEAMALIDRSSFDVAVLDWRLEGETSALIAERLAALSLPFLFHTSSRAEVEIAHPDVPIIDKPSRPKQLVHAVKTLMDRR